MNLNVTDEIIGQHRKPAVCFCKECEEIIKRSGKCSVCPEFESSYERGQCIFKYADLIKYALQRNQHNKVHQLLINCWHLGITREVLAQLFYYGTGTRRDDGDRRGDN